MSYFRPVNPGNKISKSIQISLFIFIILFLVVYVVSYIPKNIRRTYTAIEFRIGEEEILQHLQIEIKGYVSPIIFIN